MRPDDGFVMVYSKSEYDQEIPQSYTADQPMALPGREFSGKVFCDKLMTVKYD